MVDEIECCYDGCVGFGGFFETGEHSVRGIYCKSKPEIVRGDGREAESCPYAKRIRLSLNRPLNSLGIAV